LREVEAPTFSDIRLTDGGKVVSPTSRPLFTPRKIPGIHFCSRLSRLQGIVPLEGLGKFKQSTSPGTRTGNLPACSIVPQPTTLPRAPDNIYVICNVHLCHPSQQDLMMEAETFSETPNTNITSEQLSEREHSIACSRHESLSTVREQTRHLNNPGLWVVNSEICQGRRVDTRSS
jgi:hypothetical protein